MNFKFLMICITFAICTLFTTMVAAKDYAIEVIFFVNKDGLIQAAEQFSLSQVIPAPSNGISLDAVEEDFLWQPIPKQEYILSDVVNKLKRSGRYRILKHVAWRQPAVKKQDSQPILIRAGHDFSSQFPERAYRSIKFSDTATEPNTENLTNEVRELDGTINVVITRYIRLYTDLVYRLPKSNPAQLHNALDREQVLVDYSVNSHTRMHSRELHYIDHPLVGILIEATPIEEEL